MKIDLHQPAFAAIAAETDTAAEGTRDFIFKPLGVAAIWENRIDISVRSEPVRKAYPYKRADESVN